MPYVIHVACSVTAIDLQSCKRHFNGSSPVIPQLQGHTATSWAAAVVGAAAGALLLHLVSFSPQG